MCALEVLGLVHAAVELRIDIGGPVCTGDRGCSLSLDSRDSPMMLDSTPGIKGNQIFVEKAHGLLSRAGP